MSCPQERGCPPGHFCFRWHLRARCRVLGRILHTRGTVRVTPSVPLPPELCFTGPSHEESPGPGSTAPGTDPERSSHGVLPSQKNAPLRCRKL